MDSISSNTLNRIPRISKKWYRMAKIYQRFAGDYKDADFSQSAVLDMYLHESIGSPLKDPINNGYAIGKKWMDVTVASWKEDISQLGLLVSELQRDGYPDWFLRRIGVLSLVPTQEGCAWWINKDVK